MCQQSCAVGERVTTRRDAPPLVRATDTRDDRPSPSARRLQPARAARNRHTSLTTTPDAEQREQLRRELVSINHKNWAKFAFSAHVMFYFGVFTTDSSLGIGVERRNRSPAGVAVRFSAGRRGVC
jgi:hypothetical protein